MKKIFLLPLVLLALVSCSDDDSKIAPIEQISEGTIFGTAENPLNIGGPNQQNQVYIDLSDEMVTQVARDSWDFGFYAGTDFKVTLNGALMMAAKELSTSDISLPQQADNAVAVGPYMEGNSSYVDNPDGSLNPTVFGTIAASEAAAKVYLVNMGHKVPDTTPTVGSVNTTGDHRGWMKVKVWKEGNAYSFQYAAIDAAAATTVSIAKDDTCNFTFYSVTNGAVAVIEPRKDNWDICFTTFTNQVNDGDQLYAYFYSDYVITNRNGGVTAVKIEGDATAYEALTLETFTTGAYELSPDQRIIGADWRDVFTRTTTENIFFVVKDSSGNLYKIKFISMLNTNGERGYPVFPV